MSVAQRHRLQLSAMASQPSAAYQLWRNGVNNDQPLASGSQWHEISSSERNGGGAVQSL